MNYAKEISNSNVPQSQPIDNTQVKNSAGGYVYSVDKWKQLERFLILGSEGGTYYADQRSLTRDNAQNVLACLTEDPKRALDMTIAISDEGRAPKNDPAIFVLALSTTVPGAISYTEQALPRICRIGTHILQFVSYVNELRGWGRALRRIVASWYENQDVDRLQMQLTKYKNREGWTHKDVFKMAHPKFEGAKNELAKFVLGKDFDSSELSLVSAAEKAKTSLTKDLVKLIKDNGLVREHLPTASLKDTVVWEALLESMPMTALIRNLGKMSSLNMFGPLSNNERNVTQLLKNVNAVKKSRIHPFNVMVAEHTYRSGHGIKGSLSWTPNQNIVDALNNTFIHSFKNITPTGQRMYVAIDISGSMTWTNCSAGIDCMTAASAMALVHRKTEENVYTAAFNTKMVPVDFSKNDSLSEVYRKIYGRGAYGTDCAQPMIDALKNKIPVDCFVIYTDNETWFGNIHPSQALKDYRKEMGINAKLVVCAMTPTNFSIADPKDTGMLDICGFDSAGPQIISEFMRG